LTMSAFVNKMQILNGKGVLNFNDMLYVLQGCPANVTKWSVHTCTTSLGKLETRLILNFISLLVLIVTLY
jgi:hypothetical protein